MRLCLNPEDFGWVMKGTNFNINKSFEILRVLMFVQLYFSPLKKKSQQLNFFLLEWNKQNWTNSDDIVYNIGFYNVFWCRKTFHVKRFLTCYCIISDIHLVLFLISTFPHWICNVVHIVQLDANRMQSMNTWKVRIPRLFYAYISIIQLNAIFRF